MKRICSSNSIEDYGGYELHNQYDGTYVVYTPDGVAMSDAMSYDECIRFIDEISSTKSSYNDISDDELLQQYNEATGYQDFINDTRYSKKFKYYGRVYLHGQYVDLPELLNGKTYLITTAVSEAQAFARLQHKLYRDYGITDLVTGMWFEKDKYAIIPESIIQIKE